VEPTEPTTEELNPTVGVGDDVADGGTGIGEVLRCVPRVWPRTDDLVVGIAIIRPPPPPLPLVLIVLSTPPVSPLRNPLLYANLSISGWMGTGTLVWVKVLDAIN
jgi:hypothetical protein